MTYHSIERAKERANLGYEEAIVLIQNAIRKGKGIDLLPSEEKMLIEKKSHDDISFLFYKGFFFVMRDNSICITMYKAPDWFMKRKRYDGKKTIRDGKKYYKYYGYREREGDPEETLWN